LKRLHAALSYLPLVEYSAATTISASPSGNGSWKGGDASGHAAIRNIPTAT